MALTNQTNTKQLSDGGTGGTSMGQNAADKISFHNATPVVQATSIVMTTGSTIATVEARVQSIITVLKNNGLMAS